MTTYSLNKPSYFKFLFPDSASEVAVHVLNTNLATSNGVYKRNTARFGLLQDSAYEVSYACERIIIL